MSAETGEYVGRDPSQVLVVAITAMVTNMVQVEGGTEPLEGLMEPRDGADPS